MRVMKLLYLNTKRKSLMTLKKKKNSLKEKNSSERIAIRNLMRSYELEKKKKRKKGKLMKHKLLLNPKRPSSLIGPWKQF